MVLPADRDPIPQIGKPQIRIERAQALYFGTRLDDGSLTAGDHARIGPTRFEEWLGRATARI